MILKASRIASIGHARKMAAHLLKEENELVELWETTEPDHTGDALENSLVDMQLLTKMTKGQRGIFHVAIAPRDHETMSREQWEQAVVSIEQEFDLTGQARCLVYHEKDNRPHLHVCWSIVDIDRGRIIDPKFDKVRLQTIAQKLEREFGHESTRRYANDNSIEVSDKDRARESKGGRSALEQKKLLSRLWKDAKTPEDFLKMAKEEGYLVAKGDRAAILVVDEQGTPFNLARQLPKLVKAKDVRNRLAEVNLPSFEQAKEAQLKQVQPQVHGDERGKEEAKKTSQPKEKKIDAITEAFSEQKRDTTETERLTKDTGKKSEPTLSRDGETLSQKERRQKKHTSIRSLAGVMSQYMNLDEEEREELRKELQQRIKADQEAMRRREAEHRLENIKQKRKGRGGIE